MDEFDSGTTSLSRVNVTEHAEQVVGNPLVTYKLVSRVSSLLEFVRYEPDVPHGIFQTFAYRSASILMELTFGMTML